MREYEYNFNVPSLEPYIKYCESNNFTLASYNYQTRTIYKNDVIKGIGRITVMQTKDGTTTEFDFKRDAKNFNPNESQSELCVREETPAISVSNKEQVEAMFKFLGYQKESTLIRVRWVYVKHGVKVELDDYIQPKKVCNVAVEGNRFLADEVYNEIKKI